MKDLLGDWMSVTQLWAAEVTLCKSMEAQTVHRPAAEAVTFVNAVAGEVRVETGDHAFQIKTGEVLLFIQGNAHDISIQGTEDEASPALILMGAYGGSRCPVTSLWAGSSDIIHLTADETQNAGPLKTISQLLASELDTQGMGIEGMASGLLDALMVAMLRAAMDSASAGSWLHGTSDPIVSPALRAIHREPNHPWTLEKLAKVVGVSRSLFAKRFSECMGESPMGYLRRWRMALAARLLMADENSGLGTIANKVGYESQYAFSRAFKSVVGQPPGKFRRNQGIRPSLTPSLQNVE